ncbi:MAG TPA: alpha/beta hydrolase [Acidimicrobiia bacterium]|jgi:acetyl esterase/lipase
MTTVELHPELVPLTAMVPSFQLTHEALAEMRSGRNETFAALAPPLSDDVERVDHVVSNDPYVVVRVHRPKNLAAPAACLFSIHGGGYILGTYEMDDAKFDHLCVEHGCVGVSVEYRLAPETPYPGPLDDCYAALRWTFDRAGELGIDPSRVGITGVSAGGGLCAGLALLVRDRGEMDVAFQLLECPMLDDRQLTASSQYDELLIWSRESNTFGWQAYLGELYGTDAVPIYAAAARADDLSGLPPAFVIAGGADGFRDENVLYATALAHAGVPTDLCVIAGAPHGAQMFLGTTPARRWARAVNEWLAPRLTTAE